MASMIGVPVGSLATGRTTTILSGAQDSDPLNLGGMTLCGIYTPAALTSTALTFLACDKIDGVYVPVKDKLGAAITYVVAVSGFYSIDPKDFQGISFLKIRAGTAEAADRILTVASKGIA